MAGFSSVAYPFGGTRTVQANAQLGIFSAANYSSTYGTGGDDTAAVQAALNAAIAVGGVALLTPPTSGSVNISASLNIGNNGTALVGAAPGVVVKVVPGSNLDWVVSTGLKTAVDYRTVFSVNYKTQTISGNSYTTYDPSRAVKLSSGGSIQNITFVADTGTVTALGHGVMLNGAFGFTFTNVNFQGFTGEDISLWDCYGTKVISSDGTNTVHVGVHRATYDTQIVAANTSGAPQAPFRVYTEQFQIPSGPLLTLSPLFTKFVDCHHYSATALASAFDLQGAVYVNLSGCTADNVTTAISQATRFGAPTVNVLQDVGATSGVASVTAGTGISVTGTPVNPIINATSTGSVTAVTASAPLASSGGTTPNITITSPLPQANGGTGSAAPTGVTAGTGITVTGSFPNQTVSATSIPAPEPVQRQVNSFSGQSTRTLPRPTTSGNLLVFATKSSSLITLPPTGWTFLTSVNVSSLFYRIADGGVNDSFVYPAGTTNAAWIFEEFANASGVYVNATTALTGFGGNAVNAFIATTKPSEIRFFADVPVNAANTALPYFRTNDNGTTFIALCGYGSSKVSHSFATTVDYNSASSGSLIVYAVG